MKKQTLQNHITNLKKIRDACGSQLDIGALTELDETIEALEKQIDDRYSAEEVARLIKRALQVIAIVVSILTNIRDYMK
jgi:uncharacterized protein YaaN involved in tellurite resistance